MGCACAGSLGSVTSAILFSELIPEEKIGIAELLQTEAVEGTAGAGEGETLGRTAETFGEISEEFSEL